MNKLFLTLLVLIGTGTIWGEATTERVILPFRKGTKVSAAQFDWLTRGQVPYALYARYYDQVPSRKATIIKAKQRYYLSLNCGLDLFYQDSTGIRNRYTKNNHGYFCDSRRFFFRDTLWSFGGYGYWQGHATLTYFQENGEWTIYPAQNFPPYFKPLLSYHYEDYIYAPVGIHVNQAEIAPSSPPVGGYLLDLTASSWTPLVIDWQEEGFNPPRKLTAPLQLETDHYLVFEQLDRSLKTQYFITEKSTGRIFKLKGLKAAWFKEMKMAALAGDTIRLIGQKGKFHEIPLSPKLLGPLVGTIKPGPADRSNSPSTLNWVLGLGSLGFLLLGLFWGYQKYIQGRKKGSAYLSWAQKLKHQVGQEFGVNDFDRLLGIDHLSNEESRRAKRAQVVRMVNESSGNIYVRRKRSDHDRRYLTYCVEEKRARRLPSE